MAWRGYQIKGRYRCPHCEREICVTRMRNLRPHGSKAGKCPGSGEYVGPIIDATQAIPNLSSAGKAAIRMLDRRRESPCATP